MNEILQKFVNKELKNSKKKLISNSSKKKRRKGRRKGKKKRKKKRRKRSLKKQSSEIEKEDLLNILPDLSGHRMILPLDRITADSLQDEGKRIILDTRQQTYYSEGDDLPKSSRSIQTKFIHIEDITKSKEKLPASSPTPVDLEEKKKKRRYDHYWKECLSYEWRKLEESKNLLLVFSFLSFDDMCSSIYNVSKRCRHFVSLIITQYPGLLCTVVNNLLLQSNRNLSDWKFKPLLKTFDEFINLQDQVLSLTHWRRKYDVLTKRRIVYPVKRIVKRIPVETRKIMRCLIHECSKISQIQSETKNSLQTSFFFHLDHCILRLYYTVYIRERRY